MTRSSPRGPVLPGAPLDRLTELAEQARSGVPDWFVPWRAAETSAALLRYWQPFIVPGVGQTVGYMRALFADEVTTWTRQTSWWPRVWNARPWSGAFP